MAPGLFRTPDGASPTRSSAMARLPSTFRPRSGEPGPKPVSPGEVRGQGDGPVCSIHHPQLDQYPFPLPDTRGLGHGRKVLLWRERAPHQPGAPARAPWFFSRWQVVSCFGYMATGSAAFVAALVFGFSFGALCQTPNPKTKAATHAALPIAIYPNRTSSAGAPGLFDLLSRQGNGEKSGLGVWKKKRSSLASLTTYSALGSDHLISPNPTSHR